ATNAVGTGPASLAAAVTPVAAATGGCSGTTISGPGPKTIDGTLAAGDCVETAGSASWYYDVYRFTASAGQGLTTKLSSADFDTYLTLVLPDGSSFSDNSSGGGTDAAFTSQWLSQTGTYELHASSNY